MSTSLYDEYSTHTGAAHLDYHSDVGRIAKHFLRFLVPHLALNRRLADANIFEFGVGWGRNLLALQCLGARRLSGVDISREQVAIAHRLGLSDVVHREIESVFSTPQAAPQVDVLLAIDVLEHLSLDEIAAFRDLVDRQLSPDGLLVLQVPNGDAVLNPIPPGDLTHLRAFSPQSIRQLLRMMGLEPIHIAGIAYPGSGIAYAVRGFLARFVVGPIVQSVALVLYGRTEARDFVRPNILAVARRPSVTR